MIKNTYLQAKIFHLKDLFWALRSHFFKYLIFWPIDFCFLIISFFINPYRYNRKYLLKKGIKGTDEVYAYGETPLRTFTQIAHEAGVSSQDFFLELGSGRGRGALWLSFLIGCQVTGIEQMGFFVRINKLMLTFLSFFYFFLLPLNFFIKKEQSLKKKKISFIQGDYLALEEPFKEATVIYLYGTNLEEDVLKKLIQKFKVLNSTNFKTKTNKTEIKAGIKTKIKTKIITISYALSEYDQSFKTQKEWEVVFPWGKTKAYLNFLK